MVGQFQEELSLLVAYDDGTLPVEARALYAGGRGVFLFGMAGVVVNFSLNASSLWELPHFPTLYLIALFKHSSNVSQNHGLSNPRMF